MAVKYAKGETKTEVKMPTGVTKEKQGTTKQAYETDGTLVYCKLGHTKNLGNYESVRIEVGVTLPTVINMMDEAFDLSQKWCDKKLTELIEEVEKEVG